jgi:excinuclease UvrABC ATPase subunit
MPPAITDRFGQHIRLAAKLGSNLQGMCYVLDESTINHQKQ